MSFDLTIKTQTHVRAEVLRQRLAAAAAAAEDGIFESVRFIACFEDSDLADLPRALTFRISCRHTERTLADRELAAVRLAVLADLRLWVDATDGPPPIALPGRAGGS